MASHRLIDCAQPLQNAWIGVKTAYEGLYPGNTLLITSTYRSAEEQMKLFKQGRKPSGSGAWVPDEDPKTSIITHLDGYKKRSKHNSNPSAAIDFAVIILGKISWDIREYVKVGEIGIECGLVWGGSWGQPAEEVWKRIKNKEFVDGPHLEWPDKPQPQEVTP